MDAMKNGWELFKRKPAPFIIALLIWGIAIGIVGAIMMAILTVPAFTSSRGGAVTALTGGLGFFGLFLFTLVMMTLAMLAQASLVRGALKMADTGDVELGTFFKFDNVVNILLYGVVVGAASGLLAFTGIGSIIVGAFTMFGMLLVVDKNMGFLDALQGSIKYFTNNFAQSALLYVLMMVITAIGAFLCGVGMLVAAPVAMLGLTTFYRRLGSVPGDYSFG